MNDCTDVTMGLPKPKPKSAAGPLSSKEAADKVAAMRKKQKEERERKMREAETEFKPWSDPKLDDVKASPSDDTSQSSWKEKTDRRFPPPTPRSPPIPATPRSPRSPSPDDEDFQGYGSPKDGGGMDISPDPPAKSAAFTALPSLPKPVASMSGGPKSVPPSPPLGVPKPVPAPPAQNPLFANKKPTLSASNLKSLPSALSISDKVEYALDRTKEDAHLDTWAKEREARGGMGTDHYKLSPVGTPEGTGARSPVWNEELERRVKHPRELPPPQKAEPKSDVAGDFAIDTTKSFIDTDFAAKAAAAGMASKSSRSSPCQTGFNNFLDGVIKKLSKTAHKHSLRPITSTQPASMMNAEDEAEALRDDTVRRIIRELDRDVSAGGGMDRAKEKLAKYLTMKKARKQQQQDGPPPQPRRTSQSDSVISSFMSEYCPPGGAATPTPSFGSSTSGFESSVSQPSQASYSGGGGGGGEFSSALAKLRAKKAAKQGGGAHPPPPSMGASSSRCGVPPPPPPPPHGLPGFNPHQPPPPPPPIAGGGTGISEYLQSHYKDQLKMLGGQSAHQQQGAHVGDSRSRSRSRSMTPGRIVSLAPRSNPIFGVQRSLMERANSSWLNQMNVQWSKRMRELEYELQVSDHAEFLTHKWPREH